MARAPALQMGLPWQMILRPRSAPVCPSVCPPKYETFCRANGVIVAVIDWGEEGRAEGGKWIVA